MLNIYKGFFNNLNKENLNYFIYKGLDHLESDLKGERTGGDIDILLEKDYLINKYFVRGIIGKSKFSGIGLDIETKKTVWIDFDRYVRLGKNPYKPYWINLDFNKINTDLYKNIKILRKDEYILLLFLIKLFKESNEVEDLFKIQNFLEKNEINDSYMKEIFEELTDVSFDVLKYDILKAKSWEDLKKYKSIFIKKINVDYTLLFKQEFKFILKLWNGINVKVFKRPKFKVRKKGYFVAFMGNDGAGKSSTIEAVLNIDYFKLTGVKTIYFGNNHYMIPGLTKMLIKFRGKNKILDILLGILSRIDRFFIRTLKAKFFINKGYIVLGDRYLYDDLISLKYRKSKNNLINKFYEFFEKSFFFIQPDIVFFLDVDPDVAYSRKQDYDFEIVKQNIKKYREFLSNVDNVIKINANKPQQEVIKKVIKKLYEKDISINKKF